MSHLYLDGFGFHNFCTTKYSNSLSLFNSKQACLISLALSWEYLNEIRFHPTLPRTKQNAYDSWRFLAFTRFLRCFRVVKLGGRMLMEKQCVVTMWELYLMSSQHRIWLWRSPLFLLVHSRKRITPRLRNWRRCSGLALLFDHLPHLTLLLYVSDISNVHIYNE